MKIQTWNLHLLSINTILLIASCNGLPKNGKRRQKVCVIGAGVTGLLSTKQLADYPTEFEIVVFEQKSDLGGLWIYTDNINRDENGLPVQSSMYKNLRTNGPKDLMAFPDYRHFYGEERSCVTHETVLQYFKNYTDHFHLRQYIKFNTLVEQVIPVLGNGDWRTTRWILQIRDFNDNSTKKSDCDAVMVCNGHYSKPKIPEISGIETFPGRVLHSHTYRNPEEFTGNTVIILGAGTSGIEIGIEISEYAEKVYLSHNKKKIKGALPSNIVQIAGIVSANGTELTMKDGLKITVDKILFCTGYLFDYSFFDKNIKIYVENKEVQPLYKHLVNVEHPSMGFIGASGYSLTFPVYYIQARFFISLLQGKVKLPSKQEMMEKLELFSPSSYHSQWAYSRDLARQGNFEPLPEIYEKGYRIWTKNILTNIVNYKENNLWILNNGKVELVYPNGISEIS